MGHEGRERVDPERLFGPQGRFPGHQRRALRGAQQEFREVVQRRMEEGAFHVDIPFLPVQLGNLAYDFPVAVDVGGIEPDAVVAVVPADIHVGRGSGRREGGEGQVILVPDEGAPDPGGDDLAVALDGHLPGKPDRGGNRFQEAFRGVFPPGGKQFVLVIDGQAHGSERPAVVEGQDRRRIFRKTQPRRQLHGPFRSRCFRFQGLIGRFVQDFDSVGHPGGGRTVEYGEEPGSRQIGRPFLGRIDRRIGDETVRSGRCRDRNPEGTGTSAFQQAYFGRTGRSVGRYEFQVGDGAFVGKTAVFVQCGERAPDRISGQVHGPVRRHINPLHFRGGAQKAGQGQQKQGYCLFHSVSLQ